MRGGLVDLFPAEHGDAAAVRLLRHAARNHPHLRSRKPSAPPATLKAHRAGADERSAAERGDHQAFPRPLHRRFRRQHGRRPALRRDQRRPALPGHRALAAVLLRGARSVRRLYRRRAVRLRRPGASRPSPTARPRSRTTTRRASRRGRQAGVASGAPPTSRSRRNCSTRSKAQPYALAGGARALSAVALRPPDETRTEDAGGRMPPSFAAERQGDGHQPVRGGGRPAQEDAARQAGARSSPAGARARATAWRRCSPITGSAHPRLAENWRDAETTCADTTSLVVLGLETGFETDDMLVLSEQDILGERMLRPQRRETREDALTEATSLAAGDLVVHVDHGIGRFLGLKAIEAAGAPHDCVEIEYAGNTKLYLPVENIELLIRYGVGRRASSSTSSAASPGRPRRPGSRSASATWRSSSSRSRRRASLPTASRSICRRAPMTSSPRASPMRRPRTSWPRSRPVFDDLTSGRVMDRLVCGDVGFGKTEVALRAAFAVAHVGAAGGGRGADDAAGAPAFPHLLGALRRAAGQARPGVAAGVAPPT